LTLKIWLSEAKQKAKSEASRQNISYFDVSYFDFDAKLRFALFASLSQIFSDIQVDN